MSGRALFSRLLQWSRPQTDDERRGAVPSPPAVSKHHEALLHSAPCTPSSRRTNAGLAPSAHADMHRVRSKPAAGGPKKETATQTTVQSYFKRVSARAGRGRGKKNARGGGRKPSSSRPSKRLMATMHERVLDEARKNAARVDAEEQAKKVKKRRTSFAAGTQEHKSLVEAINSWPTVSASAHARAHAHAHAIIARPRVTPSPHARMHACKRVACCGSLQQPPIANPPLRSLVANPHCKNTHAEAPRRCKP